MGPYLCSQKSLSLICLYRRTVSAFPGFSPPLNKPFAPHIDRFRQPHESLVPKRVTRKLRSSSKTLRCTTCLLTLCCPNRFRQLPREPSSSAFCDRLRPFDLIHMRLRDQRRRHNFLQLRDPLRPSAAEIGTTGTPKASVSAPSISILIFLRRAESQ